MINSFLGRMHLASHIQLLSNDQLALVKAGVEYYDSLTEAKKTGLPYFPLGFTRFGADKVAAGFSTADKIYLAVWCLGDDMQVKIPLDIPAKRAKISYPPNPAAVCGLEKDVLTVEFSRSQSAVFIEVE